MLKLHIMLGADGIVPHNLQNSRNGFKFHTHDSDADSNKFCKFHEILRKG